MTTELEVLAKIRQALGELTALDQMSGESSGIAEVFDMLPDRRSLR